MPADIASGLPDSVPAWYTGPEGAIRIPIRLTQNDMAGMVGASRVSVNKVLVHYKERKYISIDAASRITLHDQEALAQRCQ